MRVDFGLVFDPFVLVLPVSFGGLGVREATLMLVCELSGVPERGQDESRPLL